MQTAIKVEVIYGIIILRREVGKKEYTKAGSLRALTFTRRELKSAIRLFLRADLRAGSSHPTNKRVLTCESAKRATSEASNIQLTESDGYVLWEW